MHILVRDCSSLLTRTSDPTAARRDAGCGGVDPMPGAPQAGTLFPEYLAQLMALAKPPL
jgi:hypothetical protein